MVQQHSTAVRNILAGRTTCTVDLVGPVQRPVGAEFSPDSRKLAVLDGQGDLLLFDTDTGHRAGKIELVSSHYGKIELVSAQSAMWSCSFQWTPDGQHLVGVWQHSRKLQSFHVFEVAPFGGAQPRTWLWHIAGEELQCCSINPATLSPCCKCFAEHVLDMAYRAVGCSVVNVKSHTTFMVPANQQFQEAHQIYWSLTSPVLLTNGTLINAEHQSWHVIPEVGAVGLLRASGLSLDGRLLAISSGGLNTETGHVCTLMDVATLTVMHQVPKRTFWGFISGKYALLQYLDHALQRHQQHFVVMDVGTGEEVCVLVHTNKFRSVLKTSASDRMVMIDTMHRIGGKLLRMVSAHELQSGRVTLQVAVHVDSLFHDSAC